MTKDQLVMRYKVLGTKLMDRKKYLQAKHLKECIELIKNSFDPEFDGRHAMIQKLVGLNEQFMDCKEEDKKCLLNECICVTAACIALFQEVE
jgi:hypothetical protein